MSTDNTCELSHPRQTTPWGGKVCVYSCFSVQGKYGKYLLCADVLKRCAALQQKLCKLISIKAKRKSKAKGSKSIQKMGDSRDPLNSNDMMQPEEAAFIWKKSAEKKQMKRLLAGRHKDPWALVLAFAESHLCLPYHQSAKAQPI